MFKRNQKDERKAKIAQADRVRDFMVKEFGEDAPFVLATAEGITMSGKNYELLGIIELIKRDAAEKIAVLDGTADGQEAIDLNASEMPPELIDILKKMTKGKGKVVELKLSDILGAMPDCGDPDCKGHEEQRHGK